MNPAIAALRRVLVGISLEGGRKSLEQGVRRLAAAATATKDLGQAIDGIVGLAQANDEETAQWIGPDSVGVKAGHFDACDLRHWLSLAEKAGVPAVPARIVATLTEDEMSVASGGVNPPPEASPVGRRILQAVARMIEREDTRVFDMLDGDPVDVEALKEKLFAAMDDVPEGWMVRHVRCGPSTLKALAGCGIAGPTAPEVKFGPDLEVGPGWVRVGNRRRIDTQDSRTVTGAAHGPSGPSVFVARPWVNAARWLIGEDPHRKGTRLEGPGCWPAEWRAFVENGEVIGVSNYYAWCGEANAENAAMALKVRAAAQKIVEAAKATGANPLFLETEMLRRHDRFREMLDKRFPRDSVSCTLDFIEVEGKGLMLLEGGPAFTPFGGGFPCAFAGLDKPDGVAFRAMPGVNLGDPKTWRETDRRGCIVGWDIAEAMIEGRLEPAAGEEREP